MLGNLLREAFAAMTANKMRTFLTMLGMVIGVAAVILMLAIGQGAQIVVQQTIATMGSNLFVVNAGSSTTAGVRSGAGNAPTLNLEDARAISELPSVAAVAPLHPGSTQVVYAGNNWNTQVNGVTPNYFEVRDWRVRSGMLFTDTEMRAMSRVAVLGQSVVEQLFGDADPVGQTIRIKNSPYVVVATLERKGQSMEGRDQDDVVLVPFTTAQRKLYGTPFPGAFRYMLVQGASEQLMGRAEQAMNALLRERHRIPEYGEPDFSIRNLSAIADAQAQTTKVMSLLLGAVASVSLLVGGIGIMNIMLVSVTERTREIGIRMAIGARRRDILLQFLLEALIVSVVGCLLGVWLGLAVAFLVTRTTGTFVVVTMASVLLAFMVAAAIGVFFGFYPARKAAGLRPIEALRYQ
jgi:putative ABC transport system permease protein